MHTLEALDQASPRAAELLLAYAIGNQDTRETNMRVARREAEDRPTLSGGDVQAIEEFRRVCHLQ